MAEFYGSVMTDLGATLLADALAGTAQIQFTALKTGDGTYTEEERSTAALQQRTALKSEKQATTFSSVERSSTSSVVLEAIVSNVSLVAGYYVREVGVYAKDASDPSSTPILYAIAVAKSADYMPPYNGLMPTTITEKFIATVNNSAEIIIETTGAYAAAEDLGNVPDLETTDKSSVVAAVNEITELTGFLRVDNAGSHNSRYRGKNLGTSVTAAQYTAIQNGTFDDMYIGDYWVIDGITWRIACFDYWLHCGDTECTTHHVVIMPDENLLVADGSTTHYMNTDNSTAGGYVGSGFYKGQNHDSTTNTAKATCRTKIQSAFGAAHILTHREYLTNAITDNHASAGAWYDSDLEIPTEKMVYGCEVYEAASTGTTIPNKYTTDKSQLPLFAHDPSKICNRANWWLRDVVSGASFAYVGSNGGAVFYAASYTAIGVRPAFAICAA
jgi:hypothetical protein